MASSMLAAATLPSAPGSSPTRLPSLPSSDSFASDNLPPSLSPLRRSVSPSSSGLALSTLQRCARGLDSSPTSFPPLREDARSLSSGPDADFLANAREVGGINCSSPFLAGPSRFLLAGPAVPSASAGTNATAEFGPSSAKSWSQVAKDKGIFSFSPLKFFPPPSKAGLDTPLAPPAEVSEQGRVVWGSTLVGMFQDKNPHFLAVHSIARKLWARFGLRNVAVNEKGIFFFTFDTVPHMEA